MTKTTRKSPPSHQAPFTLADVVRRFVRGSSVLACDHHAPVIRAFAERLAANQDPDDELLLALDESLQCIECTIITAAVLGESPRAAQGTTPAIAAEGPDGCVQEDDED